MLEVAVELEHGDAWYSEKWNVGRIILLLYNFRFLIEIQRP